MKIKGPFTFALVAFILYGLSFPIKSYSQQSIGLGTPTPDASAVLDVNSTSKGFLLPRLNAAQRDGISSPAAGLFIYNTSANKLEYWNGSGWMQLSNSAVAATNAAGTNPEQGVAISATTSPADPSAMLDIQSSTGGLLIPRMNTVQRDAIVAPIAGLLVYNTNTNTLNFYTSAGWAEICRTQVSIVTGAITTPGNAGINTATPDPSAMFDITSVTAGLAIPRMTTAQRDAILSPAQGLMLFNTTTQSINVHNGMGNWLDFISQAVSGCGAFVCGDTLTINHIIGSVAPETKTVNYGTVTTSLSGARKCWITQNLGADNQATSVTDSTDAAAGWYWQFNRKQGYKNGKLSPPTPVWTITSINETSDWIAANDPCTLLLGAGWRIPTYTEWDNANVTGGWTNYIDTYNSVLKLHEAGLLSLYDGSLLYRSTEGFCYSSTQNSTTRGWSLHFNINYSLWLNSDKANGISLRCLKD